MVVLDENTIAKVFSMIMPTPYPNGVLLQGPQPGGCLARLHNPCRQPSDRFHVARRLGGDAAQPLQEVQGCPLRFQDAGRCPFNGSNNIACFDMSTVGNNS